MEISSEKVLNKMETLIQQAKLASTIEKQKSYVTAIKALCELISDEDSVNKIVQLQSEPKRTEFIQTGSSQPVMEKPISMDDANGNSLLDF